MINLEQLRQIDLRVGRVIAAERVEGSEKLLKLQVDLGEEAGPRQILSGVAKWYAPEDMVGVQVVAVANLEPRMIMGLESLGMLLAANREDGAAVLLTALSDVPAGAKIT
jgi:methionyl-tRNA synthetase